MTGFQTLLQHVSESDIKCMASYTNKQYVKGARKEGTCNPDYVWGLTFFTLHTARYKKRGISAAALSLVIQVTTARVADQPSTGRSFLIWKSVFFHNVSGNNTLRSHHVWSQVVLLTFIPLTEHQPQRGLWIRFNSRAVHSFTLLVICFSCGMTSALTFLVGDRVRNLPRLLKVNTVLGILCFPTQCTTREIFLPARIEYPPDLIKSFEYVQLFSWKESILTKQEHFELLFGRPFRSVLKRRYETNLQNDEMRFAI